MFPRACAVAVAATLTLVGVGVLPGPVAAESGDAPAAEERSIRLGGVSVDLRKRTRQVVTVNHRSGWHATVRMWRKSGGDWRRVATARDGRTGYGGLVPGDDREQGTGTTPLGSYTMTQSFGLAHRPKGTDLRFHRVRSGDYWVQDNRSRWYNTLRNRRQGGFRWWLDGYNSSERLRDYPGQYRWSVVINFNRPDPVRHRGSGIFLHVNGSGATAGCVSTPKWFIRKTMKRLDPGKRPVIAIGR
jgi:L,D-peptidoglycan transpeptidase YkuD (ErfK/YbiS/YcfS/YnhG family)